MLGPQCLDDDLLDRCGRNPRYGPGTGLSSAQQRRADVKPIAHAVLGRKAWTHEVTLVIEQLALEQGAAFRAPGFPAGGIRL